MNPKSRRNVAVGTTKKSIDARLPTCCREPSNDVPQPTPDDTPCDDGDPCTVNDRCQSGDCQTTTDPDYVSGAAVGGSGRPGDPGGDGLVVITCQ